MPAHKYLTLPTSRINRSFLQFHSTDETWLKRFAYNCRTFKESIARTAVQELTNCIGFASLREHTSERK